MWLGAFLVGAIDRLAVALASARSAPANPADAAIATTRRDVLAHCIYGVDKDPFAIELAKVALWIHCAVPDAPLSFLDARLVCGDALIGWPLLEVPDHLPTEGFEAKVAPEDKKLLAAAKSVNIAELALQGTLLGEMPPMPPLHIELPSLLARPEHDIADVHAKAAAYADYVSSPAYRRLEAAADLWTAAFFWTAAHGPLPTTGPYRRALAGNVSVDLAEVAGRVVSVVNPLHWALAFPDVRDRGGFDLVIGNPPWEQFKGASGTSSPTSHPRSLPCRARSVSRLSKPWLRTIQHSTAAGSTTRRCKDVRRIMRRFAALHPDAERGQHLRPLRRAGRRPGREAGIGGNARQVWPSP